MGWQIIKSFYIIGGSGGIITRLYNFFRQKSAVPSPIFLKLLGFGLDTFLKGFAGIILVEHPLLARILANSRIDPSWVERPDSGEVPVYYIHGEIAAPKECALTGDVITFVPLDWTKQRLITSGIKPESIVVTGLLIEPELVENAKKNFDLRISRLKSNEPLTVAFFISQAYPKPHITKIINAVESVAKKGMKAIVFTGTDRNKAYQIKYEVEPVKSRNPHKIKLMMSENQQEENRQTAELMEVIDIMVTASHERTNWSVGLGIPIFILYPLIGTYARENYEFSLNQRVSYPIKTIEDAKTLGDILTHMQEDNTLMKMAHNGFSIYHLNGAQVIAEYLNKLN